MLYSDKSVSLPTLSQSLKGGIWFMPLTCAVWPCPSVSNYEIPVLFASDFIGFLMDLLFQMAE